MEFAANSGKHVQMKYNKEFLHVFDRSNMIGQLPISHLQVL